MQRQDILETIRQTAEANGGIPLGEDRLADLGIRPAVWQRYWPRLSAAQREAGLTPNRANAAYPEEDAMAQLALLARELGALPTSRERAIKRRQDPRFPSERVSKRLGPHARLLSRLVDYTHSHPGHEDVLALCTPHLTPSHRLAKASTVPFGS